MDPPVGAAARALLRRISQAGPFGMHVEEHDWPMAWHCVLAGLICLAGVTCRYVVTLTGQAFLDRLARCE